MTISKEEILKRLDKLPSIPAVLQEILSSFNNASVDVTALTGLIMRDQGLSAKVLRVANSPFYGLPRAVPSIQDAIMVMGFNSVRSLVLSAGIRNAFPLTHGSLFDRTAYWKRSFRVAGYAKALAKLLNHESAVLFTAAIFHDIGLLVLDVCIPVEFGKILQIETDSKRDLGAIEIEMLGFDHHEIGGELLKLWNFPKEIENVVRMWVRPDLLPINRTAAIVYIANLLDQGFRGERLAERMPRIVNETFGIEWSTLEDRLPDVLELEAGAAILAT